MGYGINCLRFHSHCPPEAAFKAADELGFKFKTYSSRAKFANNYDMINCAVSNYRSMANTGASLDAATLSFCSTLNEETAKATTEYEAEIGKKISTN